MRAEISGGMPSGISERIPGESHEEPPKEFRKKTRDESLWESLEENLMESWGCLERHRARNPRRNL